MAETSTKPYMIRAIYEWCCDNGYTPYLAVKVDGRTLVPVQHVRNGEIVLNISPLATNAMQLGNDLIEFQARFNGVPEYLSVPVGNVLAIYARETGSGMAFSPDLEDESGFDEEADEEPPSTPAVSGPASSAPGPSSSAPSSTTGGEVLAFARPQRGERPARSAGRTPSHEGQGGADQAASSSPSSSTSASSSASAQGGAADTSAEPAARPDKAGKAAKGTKDKVAKAPQSTASQSAPTASHPQKSAELPEVGQNSGVGPDGGKEPPPGGGGKPRLVRVK
ncbi:MAG: ClpXP protease specificity-enhancing factor [Lautropia sp.]|nr:ClpXP protease specificity-enhancing factor [Lautropia sp.]